ncbi:DUF6477 family protein [Paracoccus aestuariivivens]|uniref:Uncharacterized protein n=1 Tax=Paracoccus aestuariivivens TaxID=1820333 RepID=A0A6L6JDL7_9RHOB|nr:DUF6477 family protein [Paracoccus aestuariivivens]MTH79288.1 hypothetical protein [Paracoccus aestuariivivens]
MTMMPNVIQFQPRPQTAVLRRPRLLVQAARHGAASFNRSKELKRILRCEDLPAPAAALPRLYAQEQELNDARLEVKADYDLQRHIMLLIAILAETALAAPSAVTCPGKAIPAHP